MPRPSSLPAGNASHPHWNDAQNLYTFHNTGNSGGADADDIKGSRDGSLGGAAVLNDTDGLTMAATSDYISIAEEALDPAAGGFSFMWRSQATAGDNNGMIAGNRNANPDYIWQRNALIELNGIGGASNSPAIGATEYDWCWAFSQIGVPGAGLIRASLYRKTPAETSWTQLESVNLAPGGDTFIFNAIGSAYGGDQFGFIGTIEYFYLLGVELTQANLDDEFSDPYDLVEAPESISVSVDVQDLVKLKKASGTFDFQLDVAFNGSPTAIEWRFGGSGNWTVGDAAPSGGTSTITASVDGTTAAQGFEVRFANAPTITGADDRPCVADEVWVIEGDSIADGRAANPQTYTARTYQSLYYTPATGWIDPGVWDTTDSDGSQWPILAERLSDEKIVCFIDSGSSGADFGDLSAASISNLVDVSGCESISGVLAHGGANDAATSEPETASAAAWQTMVETYANDIAATWPGAKTLFCILGDVGSLSNKDFEASHIREGTILAAAANANVEIGAVSYFQEYSDGLHPITDFRNIELADLWYLAVRDGGTDYPTFVQATHDTGKTSITVQFDQILRTGTTLSPNCFEVTDDGTPVAVSEISVSGVNATLTLASPATGALVVSLGKGEDPHGVPPQGTGIILPNSSGTIYPPGMPFFNQAVAAADDVPPVHASSRIPPGGTTVDVTITETGTPPLLPLAAISGFSLASSGGVLAILAAQRTAATVITLTVDRPILGSEVVTVSYSGGNVTDSAPAANALTDFANQPVTNDSTQSAGGGVYPAEGATLAGVSFGPNGNDFTGNVVLPVSADVQANVLYGPDSLIAGNFGVPAEAQVENGVQFGGNGNEFTGSLVVTGGSCDHNAIAAEVASLLANVPIQLLSVYNPSKQRLEIVQASDYQNAGASQAIDISVNHPGVSEGDLVHFGAAFESERILATGSVIDDAGQLKARITLSAADLDLSPSQHWKYSLVHEKDNVHTALAASAPMSLIANQVS